MSLFAVNTHFIRLLCVYYKMAIGVQNEFPSFAMSNKNPSEKKKEKIES